jgi:putative methionine-R-sulfoxide reductase with GAF domain
VDSPMPAQFDLDDQRGLEGMTANYVKASTEL